MSKPETAQSASRSELVALANRFGDQAIIDAVTSVWPDAVRGPSQRACHPRADEDPRVGDLIRMRRRVRNQANPARRIISISTGGEWIETGGMSGRQRNSMMSRARLAAYDRLERDAP